MSICEKIGHLDNNHNCNKPLSHSIPHAWEQLSREAKAKPALYSAGQEEKNYPIHIDAPNTTPHHHTGHFFPLIYLLHSSID
jgi:hypothetical protein